MKVLDYGVCILLVLMLRLRKFEALGLQTNPKVICIPPSISSYGNVSEIEGSILTVRCRVRGSPAPDITWMKMNEEIKNSDHFIVNAETLTIIGTTQNDNGLYRCVANNHVHKPVSAEFYVTISKQYLRNEPKIMDDIEVITHKFGNPLTINCRAYGWPIPKVRWLKDGDILNNGETYNISGQSLTINKINDTSNEVSYICQASNNDFISYFSHTYYVENTHSIATRPPGYCKENDCDYSERTETIPQRNKDICKDSILKQPILPTTSKLITFENSLNDYSKQPLRSEKLPKVSKLLSLVLNFTQPTDSEKESDFKSTQSILRSMQTFLNDLDLSDSMNGTATHVTPFTAILVTDSNLTDVIGMMTFTSDDLALTKIKPLQEGIKDKDEVLANSVVRIKGKNLNRHAIHKLSFVVFRNSRTFLNDNKNIMLDSHVVAVSAPEGKVAMLTSVEIELKPLNLSMQPGQKRQCAYWELEAGEWRTDGCVMLRHDVTTGRDVCECQRLAHFGLILGVEGVSPILHNISLTGCILSILGLLGIIMTAIAFPKWRAQLGNKILLHLSVAIGLIMSAFLSIALGGTNGGPGSFGCVTLGVVLHYSVLAAFCWMLVTAVLQFFRFVIVFDTRPPRFLLKGALFSWGLPCIPVITLLIIGPQYYSSNENMKFCYPQGLSLILAVVTPVALVVIANLILFSIIIYKVTCGRGETIKINANETLEKQMLIAQLKMTVLLFFLLGLTWVFGLLALVSPKYREWQILFLYLFCITATFQGFILFLYFIILDKKARRCWIHLILKMFCTIEGYDSYSKSTNGGVSRFVRFLRRLDENDSSKSDTSTRSRETAT